MRDLSEERFVVGVIQIVFDAEPQLAAMLANVLPRDRPTSLCQGAALFAERAGRVVSLTSQTS